MFVFRLVQLRRVYYVISGIVVALGLLTMILSTLTRGTPFPLGIDFVGGSIYELTFSAAGATESGLRDVFERNGATNVSIQRIGAEAENRWSVRAPFAPIETQQQILSEMGALAPLDAGATRTESLSASVGAEASRAAVVAVLVATVVVTGFIVIAFRSVPNALRYGVCAIAAMFHDVLVVCGIAAILGLVLGWDVDALFLTAVLTVVGFSVQDTIVVFDRIRENIPRRLGEPYETIVNRSVIETLHRSLATQLNAFFIMIAILLFGGDSVKQFIAILFVGLLTGTYSSIFIAVPLLVSWELGEIPFINRAAKRRRELAAVSAEPS
jgi:preprotein translocase SecF subunit